MIGQTILHYKILEKLGEGGMGIVYKAHDTKLDRDVALKFLPHHVTATADEQARFLQEARAASALNHPNVCVIHDIQEHEGQQFIVMEYVDGKTLRQLVLVQKTQIAIDYAIQIGEALQEAHGKGIVHRDVKTDNIMVNSKNQIKVMDFGLAKLKGSLKLTKTSSTVGTLAYMAPEQIQGEPVDARSDIFSFGVVLYEMLTGHLPFRGEHEAAMVYSIVNEEPLSLKSFQADAPEGLEAIIRHCLEKDPHKRYQSAKAVIDELKRLKDGKPGPTRKRSVVPTVALASAILFILAGVFFFWPSKQADQEKTILVLPFHNNSPNKENDYIDGLTDEIITQLSRVKALDVKPKHTSNVFKETKKNISEIASEVNVRYILEGSVRKQGNDLRIVANLIDARNNRSVWGDTYPGTLNDIFQMQENVSREIVKALSITLSPEEMRSISERPINNAQAYDYYLRARHEIDHFEEASFARAKKNLDAGLEIVGPNPVLYGTIAYLYWNYANLGIKIDENLVKADEYVQKALDLDPRSPQAHLALGSIYGNLRPDLKKSITHIKAVLETNPRDFDALMFLTLDYCFAGKMDSARKYGDELVKVDPSYTVFFAGFLDFYQGRFKESVDPILEAYHADSANAWNLFFTPIVLAYNGRIDQAKAISATYFDPRPKTIWPGLAMLLRYALDDNQQGMRMILSTPDLQKSFKRDCQNSQFVSQFYAIIGNKKEALDWLENAINRGFINYPLIFERDPFFRTFKDDERFKKLAQRMKTEWENFKD